MCQGHLWKQPLALASEFPTSSPPSIFAFVRRGSQLRRHSSHSTRVGISIFESDRKSPSSTSSTRSAGHGAKTEEEVSAVYQPSLPMMLIHACPLSLLLQSFHGQHAIDNDPASRKKAPAQKRKGQVRDFLILALLFSLQYSDDL